MRGLVSSNDRLVSLWWFLAALIVVLWTQSSCTNDVNDGAECGPGTVLVDGRCEIDEDGGFADGGDAFVDGTSDGDGGMSDQISCGPGTVPVDSDEDGADEHVDEAAEHLEAVLVDDAGLEAGADLLHRVAQGGDAMVEQEQLVPEDGHLTVSE